LSNDWQDSLKAADEKELMKEMGSQNVRYASACRDLTNNGPRIDRSIEI